MKKLSPVAVVATGKLMHSFVRDLPAFRERLGLVKAVSLRVASRITNALRAGIPVENCESIGDFRTVLICVPDEAARETVAELAACDVEWRRRTVLLCDSQLTSDALRPLKERGAHVAAFDMPAGGRGMLLADGDRSAITEVKALAGRGVRIVKVFPYQKSRFYEGLALASLCGPLAALVGEHFRAAGLTPAQAKPIVESVFAESVRDYLRSGRKVLGRNAPPDRSELLRVLMQAAV